MRDYTSSRAKPGTSFGRSVTETETASEESNSRTNNGIGNETTPSTGGRHKRFLRTTSTTLKYKGSKRHAAKTTSTSSIRCQMEGSRRYSWAKDGGSSRRASYSRVCEGFGMRAVRTGMDFRLPFGQRGSHTGYTSARRHNSAVSVRRNGMAEIRCSNSRTSFCGANGGIIAIVSKRHNGFSVVWHEY